MDRFYDGMSAPLFAEELNNTVDKNGDSISQHIDIINRENLCEYSRDEVIPASFLTRMIPSLSLFLYGFCLSDSGTEDSTVDRMRCAILNLAFGENCEDMIFRLGDQLAEFSKYAGRCPEDCIEPLKECNNIWDIKRKIDDDDSFFAGLKSWLAFKLLVHYSSYASSILPISLFE